MSLKYKTGDLIAAALNEEVDIIAHGCNCFNTMKSGIAPQIANAFKEAWVIDQQTIAGDKGKLGTIKGVWSHGVLVYNLYTQYGWGGYKRGVPDFSLPALESALTAMKKDILHVWDGESAPKVGLPKIGAGYGGGDWNLISKAIEDILLPEIDVTVYVL